MARSSSGLSEVPLSVTVTEPIAEKLRRLADLEALSLSATARRIIALNIDRELSRIHGEQAVARG